MSRRSAVSSTISCRPGSSPRSPPRVGPSRPGAGPVRAVRPGPTGAALAGSGTGSSAGRCGSRSGGGGSPGGSSESGRRATGRESLETGSVVPPGRSGRSSPSPGGARSRPSSSSPSGPPGGGRRRWRCSWRPRRRRGGSGSCPRGGAWSDRSDGEGRPGRRVERRTGGVSSKGGPPSRRSSTRRAPRSFGSGRPTPRSRGSCGWPGRLSRRVERRSSCCPRRTPRTGSQPGSLVGGGRSPGCRPSGTGHGRAGGSSSVHAVPPGRRHRHSAWWSWSTPTTAPGARLADRIGTQSRSLGNGPGEPGPGGSASRRRRRSGS